MNRTPPLNVQRKLRKEVNFGCPLPGCGEPFLSWHHFDPTWAVREHHDPDGMIALCIKHHKAADIGLLSQEQLRYFKKHPNDTSFIRSKFEWIAENPIIRLGGCYAHDWCRVKIKGIVVLEIGKDENGWTRVSFILKDQKGRLLASMCNNIFSFSSEFVHDLSVSASGHEIRIFLEERKIGFHCRCSRKSIEEIESYINNDYPDMPDWVGPPEPIDDLNEFYRNLSKFKKWWPDVAAIGHRRHDPTGTMIRWHASRHFGEDQKVPFIDFVSCRFWSNSECIELRDGIMGNLEFFSGNNFSF